MGEGKASVKVTQAGFGAGSSLAAVLHGRCGQARKAAKEVTPLNAFVSFQNARFMERNLLR